MKRCKLTLQCTIPLPDELTDEDSVRSIKYLFENAIQKRLAGGRRPFSTEQVYDGMKKIVAWAMEEMLQEKDVIIRNRYISVAKMGLDILVVDGEAELEPEES